MNRKLLEKSFDLSLIKQRKGNHGDTPDYVERRMLIQRLNDAYDGLSNLEIMDQHIFDDEVVVLGPFSAGDVIKM
jgi:hypothetical protein